MIFRARDYRPAANFDQSSTDGTVQAEHTHAVDVIVIHSSVMTRECRHTNYLNTYPLRECANRPGQGARVPNARRRFVWSIVVMRSGSFNLNAPMAFVAENTHQRSISIQSQSAALVHAMTRKVQLSPMKRLIRLLDGFP